MTHNQLPELYCSSGTVDPQDYPADQLRCVTEGAGGGNVLSYFCTSSGQVVGYLAGYWRPSRYLEETRWALARMSQSREALARPHGVRASRLQQERDALHPPDQVQQLLASGPPARRAQVFAEVAAFNRLGRSHRESRETLHWPIRKVLQKVEDEVYTKGALGCDS